MAGIESVGFAVVAGCVEVDVECTSGVRPSPGGRKAVAVAAAARGEVEEEGGERAREGDSEAEEVDDVDADEERISALGPCADADSLPSSLASSSELLPLPPPLPSPLPLLLPSSELPSWRASEPSPWLLWLLLSDPVADALLASELGFCGL